MYLTIKREIKKIDMKILKLTVHKKAFEVMVTGEKTTEYRNPSKWILSRLFDKSGNPKMYDGIEIRNGYGESRPSFIAEFRGFEIETNPYSVEYTNGLKVKTFKGMVKIYLGDLVAHKR